MKVALIHDYLGEPDDAERVLHGLHQMYPIAPVYIAFVDRAALLAKRFANWDLRPTWAQNLPAIVRHSQLYRALLPYFWESLDLSDYDLVISSSGNHLSKSVLTAAKTLHVCYCHTPPRSLWQPNFDSARSRPWLNLWTETSLRQYDFYAAQRVDRFVANSETVARRIKKFYRRSAEVIHPPIQFCGQGQAGKDYYLYVGELTQQQQVDLAIAACGADRPLWIVGTGHDRARLQQLAPATTKFLDPVPETEMAALYANARAVIFPATEADFAIAPVEAMGHGVPVIASALSGMKTVILNYRTGLLFTEPTVDSLRQAIVQFEGLRFSAQACIERAEEFATAVFTSKLSWLIAQALDEHRGQAIGEQ